MPSQDGDSATHTTAKGVAKPSPGGAYIENTPRRPALPLIVKTDVTLEVPRVIRDLLPFANIVTTIDDEESTILSVIGDATILLTCYARVTPKVFEAAPKLKAVIKYGVGIDQIDVAEAKRRNVVVVNIPYYAENTVAEMAFALMISLVKKIHEQQVAMRKEWLWPNSPKWMGQDLEGKTVGVVGLGYIGSSFARMCNGFLMNVIAYDPHKNQSYMEKKNVERVDSMEALVQRSDIVAMHAVLNDDTRHILSARLLSLMKPTAIVINTARGALVDEGALTEALITGRIAGAGLDVFSEEPVTHRGHVMSRLYALVAEGRVLLTPHLAFYTVEAMDRLEKETVERAREVLEGRAVLLKSREPRLQGQRGVDYQPRDLP